MIVQYETSDLVLVGRKVKFYGRDSKEFYG